jgi:hypothetical protein
MAERETKVTVTAEVDGYIAGMERATEATLGLAAAARELLAAGINPADITPTVLRSVELLASAGRSGGADVPPGVPTIDGNDVATVPLTGPALDALRALEEESAQETAARVSAVGVNVYSIKRPAYRRVVTAEKFDQPGPVVADQGQWLAAARELGAAGIRGDDLVNSLHEILERGHPRDYETWRAFLTTRTDDQLVEEYGRDLVRAAVVLARAKQ